MGDAAVSVAVADIVDEVDEGDVYVVGWDGEDMGECRLLQGVWRKDLWDEMRGHCIWMRCDV